MTAQSDTYAMSPSAIGSTGLTVGWDSPSAKIASEAQVTLAREGEGSVTFKLSELDSVLTWLQLIARNALDTDLKANSGG